MVVLIAPRHHRNHAAVMVQEAWRRRREQKALREIRGELYTHEVRDAREHEKKCCPCLSLNARWGHEPADVRRRVADGGHAVNDLPFQEWVDAKGAQRCAESASHCARCTAGWFDFGYGVHKVTSDSDTFAGQLVVITILALIFASCLSFIFETLPLFQTKQLREELPSLHFHAEWERGEAALAQAQNVAGLGAFLDDLEARSGIPFARHYLNSTFVPFNLTAVADLCWLDADDLYDIGMTDVFARAVFLDGLRSAPWGAPAAMVAQLAPASASDAAASFAEWTGGSESVAMQSRHAEERAAAHAAVQRWRYSEATPDPMFQLLEVLFIIVFTGEYIIRLLTAIYTPWERAGIERAVVAKRFREKCNALGYGPATWPVMWTVRDAAVKIGDFLSDPMNAIDLLAIAPFYISYGESAVIAVFKRLGLPSAWIGLDLRILRVIRVAKLVRYSKDMRMLLRVLRKSVAQLALLVLLMGILSLVFGALMFFVENASTIDAQTGKLRCWNEVKGDYVESPFRNIPQSSYWLLVSISQVGWGDVYPVSIGGHIVGMISVIVGVIVVALPVGVIGSNWANEFEDSSRVKRVHFIRIGNFAMPITKRGRLAVEEQKIERRMTSRRLSRRVGGRLAVEEQTRTIELKPRGGDWDKMVKQSKVRRRLSVELGALHASYADSGVVPVSEMQKLRKEYGAVPELLELIQVVNDDDGLIEHEHRQTFLEQSVEVDGSVKLAPTQLVFAPES